jgi:hypothetical protein
VANRTGAVCAKADCAQQFEECAGVEFPTRNALAMQKRKEEQKGQTFEDTT